MNGIIRWFIDNPIAANLLMLAMLIGGVSGYSSIKKETFPIYSGNRIDISMVYPGAGPGEVEQQIAVRIEEAIAGLPGIFQIRSESNEGIASVSVSVEEDYDVRELLDDVKARIDAINTFPSSAEQPVIQQAVRRPFLMWATLYGDVELDLLKKMVYQIRDEMSLLEGVSEVLIQGLKIDELSIEVSEQNLRRYNLSFDEIATAIRNSSLNLPAGAIKSKDGDLQIQTRSQAYDFQDFADIVVRAETDGKQLLLSDVATINDGFSEENVEFVMNGKPGLNLEIKMSDDPLLFEGTENARKYIEDFQRILPEGVIFKINFESKDVFDSRYNLLKDNAVSGLFLVFIILMLFLRPQLSMWVVLGIATTFCGAIWLLPYFDVSINMLSMFAFIMVLGIVVDDAIIVGENIYTFQQQGEEGKDAAYKGTITVLKPVFLAVLSTIIFFLPMIDVPSDVLIYTQSIFFVVFLCLVFSLVESLLVLPSHLSHLKPEKKSKNTILQKIEKIRFWFSDHLEGFAKNRYLPVLETALAKKRTVFAGFFVVFAISMAVIINNWIAVSPFPNVPGNYIIVNVEFSPGTPFSQTQRVGQRILDEAAALNDNEDLLALNKGQPFIREFNKTLNNNSASIFVGITEAEDRTIALDKIVDIFRERIGPLPEAQSFSLDASLSGGQPEITLNINMLENRRDIQQLAINDVVSALGAFPGVFNVRSDLASERIEVDIKLLPHAQNLGISLGDVAKQIRQGFYGEEIQRIPRAKEDVRVMLRYSADERQTLDTLDTIRVRTNDGRELPVTAVADIQLVKGSSTIRRVDRRRNITVTAEVEEGVDASVIVKELLDSNILNWKQKYTGLNIASDGNLRTQAEFGDNFGENYLKVFILVAALFMVAFRSLFQPFLVMLAIPFGFVGALIGHLAWDVNISFFSMFGFLACSGVVVNDNLVLLESINRFKEKTKDTRQAVLSACIDRFRPIVLTSITTFVGLLPIMFERSLQAQFLKPMVIALSCGVVFSSVVTLFLVPCGFYAGTEFKIKAKAMFEKWSSKVNSKPDLRKDA